VRDEVHFEQMKAVLSVDEETLSWYNPTYRKGVIPADGRAHALRLPYHMIAGYITQEDSIKKVQPVEPVTVVEEPETIVYRVKSGDALGTIAKKHGVTLAEIKAWNHLRSNMIKPGQKLVIYPNGKNKSTAATVTPSATAKEKEKETRTIPEQWYTVQKGDTLWNIATKHQGVTVEKILQLNAGLNAQYLKQGQKIRIR
jgi:membrane-bound lytic murein transglycosylase D